MNLCLMCTHQHTHINRPSTRDSNVVRMNAEYRVNLSILSVHIHDRPIDDLNVSPDFFDYFLATHTLLKNDDSLWCVSAWNDNGKANIIDESRPDLLYRTDFFPGLGWMLTRKLWSELSPKWPKA